MRAPRLMFDCLAYLIEHRDRVVGTDELVSAVWGRVDVAGAQVRQLIARVRALVDDNAADQRAIRTVPGVGYRWVVAVDLHAPLLAVKLAVAESVQAPSSADVAAEDSSSPPELGQAPDLRIARKTTAGLAPISANKHRPWWMVATFAVLALLLVSAIALLRVFAGHEIAIAPNTESAGVDTTRVIAVLPLDVNGPDDAAWVRLGAMDLIASRLRSGGLPVPRSESVVSALHAVGEPLDAGHLAKLRRALGAESLVQGAIAKSASGWKVDLTVTVSDGLRYTSQAERPDVTDAARQAADLLLAAMGYVPSPAAIGERSDDLGDLLQRAEAALLANQLGAARSILDSTPERLRNDARIRLKLAQVDQRAGKLDQAHAMLTALLEDDAVTTQPALRAEVLTTLGFIGMNRNDCAVAERQFDAALAALPDQRNGLEAGTALAARATSRSCLQRFDAAIADLGTAGSILQAAGDRLGLARVNAYFGAAEFDRHRPAEAVPYLLKASDLHESLGALDNLRNDLGLLILAQTQLLQWSEALKTSERLRVLSEQADSAAALYMMAGVRARVLIGLGRYGEAGSLLRTTENAKPAVDTAFALTFHEAKAELAWALGNPRQTIAEIANAWKILPLEQMRDDEDVYTILLHQRASLALGDDAASSVPGEAPPTAGDSGSHPAPAFLVARAEWAAQQGNAITAENEFRHAIASLDTRSVPSSTVLVVDAYARWLLAQQRTEEARAIAGRILPWADRDFQCALLQVTVFHALGQDEAWARALKQAQALAGERRIPEIGQIARSK